MDYPSDSDDEYEREQSPLPANDGEEPRPDAMDLDELDPASGNDNDVDGDSTTDDIRSEISRYEEAQGLIDAKLMVDLSQANQNLVCEIAALKAAKDCKKKGITWGIYIYERAYRHVHRLLGEVFDARAEMLDNVVHFTADEIADFYHSNLTWNDDLRNTLNYHHESLVRAVGTSCLSNGDLMSYISETAIDAIDGLELQYA